MFDNWLFFLNLNEDGTGGKILNRTTFMIWNDCSIRRLKLMVISSCTMYSLTAQPFTTAFSSCSQFHFCYRFVFIYSLLRGQIVYDIFLFSFNRLHNISPEPASLNPSVRVCVCNVRWPCIFCSKQKKGKATAFARARHGVENEYDKTAVAGRIKAKIIYLFSWSLFSFHYVFPRHSFDFIYVHDELYDFHLQAMRTHNDDCTVCTYGFYFSIFICCHYRSEYVVVE